MQNIRLIIGGDGSMAEKLKKYIESHELRDVIMLGYVGEKEKPRLYASCDIFCSPAYTGEAFGIVLLEAMAEGKPIIAGLNDGYKCALKGKAASYLVNPKKIKEFTEKLEELCLDRNLRLELGRWGIEEVKQYAWPRVTDELVRKYKEVIAKRKARKKLGPSARIVEKIINSIEARN